MSPAKPGSAKLIKKYANRRLYDTEKSRYITLADLTLLAREHIEFVVEDAKTGQEITRQILVQIISDHEVDEETSVMTVDALREMVGLYVPSPINQMFIDYLGNALTNFMRQQTGLQQHMDGLFAEFAPTIERGSLNEQQADMWSSLMETFVPKEADAGSKEESVTPEDSTAKKSKSKRTKSENSPPEKTEASTVELNELQRQMVTLQQQLNELANK
ncbi:MAG: hypothetical protein JKY89_06995 [Immundisolibacteraceae bacterium]|nr:hypothetical protein [Immundisolibacteraceae bacterium]